MSQRHFTRQLTWRKTVPIVLAVAGSVIAGASFLIDSSPLSALVVAGLAAVIAFGIGCLRNPVWALYLACFVVFLPTGLLPSSAQSLLNRATVGLALGVWFVDIISRKHRIILTHTTLLMMAFLGWGIIALLWAPSMKQGVEQVAQYASRIVLFLVLAVNHVYTRERLDKLMRLLASIGWVWVLSGTVTILIQGIEAGVSLQVLETNINSVGAHLLMALPGVLWQAATAPRRRKTPQMLLSITYMALAVTVVALGGSRGSAISLIVILGLLWFWKDTRPWARVGLLVLGATAVLAPVIFSTVVRRFAEGEGGPFGGRLVIWQASWSLIRENPWLGVGIGNAEEAVIPYLRLLTSIGGRVQRSIHNPVLQVWAETGLPGLLLYLSALGAAVWSFSHQYLRYKATNGGYLIPYFAIVSSTFISFMLLWIKGGGMEHTPSYFFMVALLLLPAQLDSHETEAVLDKAQLVGASDL